MRGDEACADPVDFSQLGSETWPFKHLQLQLPLRCGFMS